MRKKIAIGNWKMNGNIDSISQLLERLSSSLQTLLQETCVILPPAIYIPMVSSYLAKTSIKWGAQNVYPCDSGAMTGELSGPMLKDYHCDYVLVGHSERRRMFVEDETFIAEKFHHIKEHGMMPILCIGETLEEREQGLTSQVLARQLRNIEQSNRNAFSNSIIAYEPVWAIGTGRAALPEQVQAMHVLIRSFIAESNEEVANHISILYGGSVNANNALSLFAMPDVDGGLIGGASLNAQQFVEIVKCINSF